jgi:hypothetical protein
MMGYRADMQRHTSYLHTVSLRNMRSRLRPPSPGVHSNPTKAPVGGITRLTCLLEKKKDKRYLRFHVDALFKKAF